MQFNFINSFKGLFFPSSSLPVISLRLSSLLRFLLASPQARGWGLCLSCIPCLSCVLVWNPRGLPTLVGHGSSHWSSGLPPAHTAIAAATIKWFIGGWGARGKKKGRKKTDAFFYISPFSWSSRQNQRAFPGTLFVNANTHFKILHCIGFSPGDIGGGKNNKFTTDLCYFDIWSSLSTIMPVSPLSWDPALSKCSKMASIVDFIITTYLVAGRRDFKSMLCQGFMLYSVGETGWVCLPHLTPELETPSQFLKDIKHASIQRWCGAKANV